MLLQQERFEQVLYEIFTLEETNNNYKDLMTYLSVILAFRMVSVDKFIDLIANNAHLTGLEGKTRE